MKSFVILDFDIEGFHNYPNAPTQVSFLSNKHRHLFRIEIGICVTELNREKEIFIEQDIVKDIIRSRFGMPAIFGQMSCEHIAKFIIDNYDCSWCKVLEDGRGGALINK